MPGGGLVGTSVVKPRGHSDIGTRDQLFVSGAALDILKYNERQMCSDCVNGPGYIAVGYQLTVANRFTDWFG